MYKEKDEKFLVRVEQVKTKLKEQNEQYREAMEGERTSMLSQLDHYKLLTAELKTENLEQKKLMEHLKEEANSAIQKKNDLAIDKMGKHVKELQLVVDDYKARSMST
mmetsp:Transcript_17485/g.16708  ORF Transcript_17485/g.16708 Transcript_17485/m.16708 type:complete len:107 (+) Transcript_17485:837-1157(+)